MLFFYVEALHNHSNYKLNLNKEKLIGAWWIVIGSTGWCESDTDVALSVNTAF